MRYRKWGRVVRWENGVIVHVDEGGEAIEGDVFEARPLDRSVILGRPSISPEAGSEGEGLPAPRLPVEILSTSFGKFDHAVILSHPSAALRRPGSDGEGPQKTQLEVLRFGQDDANSVNLPNEVLRSIQDDRRVERLIVSEGVAVHDCDGIRWTERTRRVHVSLTHAPLRATVDLADFDFDLITRIDLRDVEERTFESIRLAPHVFASFLPELDIEKEQMPAPHDGRGKAIERMRVSGDPRNVYRPSYRVRPVPAWFNLRAIPFGVIDREAPEAIARLDDGLLVIHDGRTFVARPRIDIKAAGESERWYPYAAGSFGAEAMI